VAAAMAARGGGLDPLTLALLLIVAAILGNTTNYWIGRALGPKVFHWEHSRWFNRRALQDIAEREFQRGRRAHSPMSFMIFDIDHFKSVNDRFGHAVGDAAIRHVTAQAAHALRGYDGLFRIGGEEFAAIIADAPFEQLQQIGERLRALIESAPMMVNGQPLTITVSVGMATCEASDLRWEDILRRADDALYCAKRGGRNQVRRYHSDLAPVLAERSRFASAA